MGGVLLGVIKWRRAEVVQLSRPLCLARLYDELAAATDIHDDPLILPAGDSFLLPSRGREGAEAGSHRAFSTMAYTIYPLSAPMGIDH